MTLSFLSKLEFWQQQFIAFTVGIAILAISTSTALTITSKISVKNQIVEQALYLTNSVSRQSRLSLLYLSKEEATDAANIALQYPDVVGVEIRSDEGVVLASLGTVPSLKKRTSLAPEMVLETEESLVFLAPAKNEVDDEPLWIYDTKRNEPDDVVIGYVILVISKNTLNQISRNILKTNVFVSVAIAGLLLFLLSILTRRLTVPLKNLSEVMHRAEDGEMHLRATYTGPRDIVNMQKAFNTMMTALETRTQELSTARDKALESAQIKADFAANVSHELRTPMNSVLGMLDLLSVMGLDNQQYEYVETAKLSAKNLLFLIDDILSYVRSDTGNLVLENTPCNLTKLIEEVLTLHSPQAMKKNVDIGYTLPSDLDNAYLDDQRLHQILVNLIGNAIKFTDSGEISITISLEQTVEPTLVFSIKDTGVGIDEEIQKQIFEAFTQGDSSTTRKYGGTGLGLAISRQFVKLMGGEIAVYSQLGVGSNFVFKLPYISVSTDVDLAEDETILLSKLNNKHVVICDDSFIVREFLHHWFAEYGARLKTCSNTYEFFEYIERCEKQKQSIDYLFVDENILGININDFLTHIDHYNCTDRSKNVVMVNPWTNTHQYLVKESNILEKPLLKSHLLRFFGVNTESGARTLNEISNVDLDLKILVVDDNQTNCLVAGGMLQQIGCTYDFAYNGKEALEKLSRQRYDMVLMDCNMPVMDGYKATHLIRERKLLKMPVIAMTADNSENVKNKCTQHGMNDFLPKPLSVDAIYTVLHKWTNTEHLPSHLTGQLDAGLLLATGKNFNVDKLATLEASVGELFPSVVDAFIEDTPIYLTELKKALADENFKIIREVAHSIKGSAGNFGADSLTNIAKYMEDAAEAGVFDSLEASYSNLCLEAATLVDELNAYLVDRRGSLGADKSSAYSVVVADDDRATCSAIANVLKGEGYDVSEADNGQSVLALCSRKMPDLILMDAIMPEVDGFSACMQIRAMPYGDDTPILMITSLTDEKSIAKAFKMGATDFLSKPINYSLLKQRVVRLLDAKTAQKHIQLLSYQDSLTELPNRAYFNHQLRHALDRATLYSTQVAILFLDLNKFKVVNDTLGHDTGDLILKTVAQRLQGCIRSNDLLSRFGGDEFCILIDDVSYLEMVTDICEKIVELFATAFEVGDQSLHLTTSIGVSIFPDHSSDAGTLIKNAEIAMYKAKGTKTPLCHYNDTMADSMQKSLNLDQDIRQALAGNELHLHFQPQYSLANNEIHGVEALVRWEHPHKGLLVASEFIHSIDEVGLLGELSRFVFREACVQIKRWHQQGLSIRVAVNVSGGDFVADNLSTYIIGLIDEYQIPAQMLEVEITESVLMDQPDLVQTELLLLRERGIFIAIDDFGSGYSSLNYLKKFSIDIIKIDRDFVRECHKDENDKAIISGIVSLAKSLHLEVVAEGIEVPGQLSFLRSVGCDYVQGFLFSLPLPAADIHGDMRI